MKLPDGVVSLRKVKTVFAGEDAHVHLTWVLAYNAGIEVGSPRYEAIRTFAGGLKAPPRVAQSVMFLPIAPPDTSQAPPRSEPRPRPARPANKSGASKSGASKPRASKSRTKRRPRTIAKPAKPAAKAAAKRAARTAGKPAAKRRPTRATRATRTRQRRSRR
jgi:hypothetical protein